MKRLLTNKDLIKSVSGIITEMAPGMKPRNLQAIVDYVDKYFREDCKDRDGYYKGDRLVMFYIEEDDVRNFIDKLLKGCKEFNDLNLSQDEIDRGITVDDPSRPKWVVGGASDGSHLKEYYDFIDLDACVRNITNDLYWAFLDNDLFEQRCEIVDIKEFKALEIIKKKKVEVNILEDCKTCEEYNDFIKHRVWFQEEYVITQEEFCCLQEVLL